MWRHRALLFCITAGWVCVKHAPGGNVWNYVASQGARRRLRKALSLYDRVGIYILAYGVRET